ncbi:glycosyltransferase family 4 protein [Carnobacterium inhibens]|uniref:glycosyltransferase family 4 protein n=1 Tax=Carnobacterium inhibens TaxID=147709 RepID=UPI0004104175|nr:glycosyltransferase family 4 protein [Carnobacterium inhibens]
MEKADKPKVLLVHNYYQIPGGEDSVFYNEKKLLEVNGHEVITYTRNNQEITKFNILDKIKYPFNSVFSIKGYRDIKKIIKYNNVELLHVHNTWPLISPSVYYAAFKCNIPVVQTIHNFRMICPGATLYYNGKICEDSLYKGLKSTLKLKIYKGSFIQTLISAITLKTHRIFGTYKRINYIFLTEFNKKKILELNNKGKTIIDESKTFIKPNFVNGDKVIIPFDKRKNQFVFAGRLDKSKGIVLLLKAWLQIKDFDLIICGTGPEEEWCKKFIKDNKLTNVKFFGFISNEKTVKIISESKALILPTQWYEGFPMTIAESLSSGTPVIGSDIGNVGDIIDDEVNGIKFKYNSIDSLRDSIYRFESIDGNQLVLNAASIFKKKYNSKSNYEILNNIYKNVLK